MFADIALDVPKALQTELFTYKVPAKYEATIKPGQKVVVPFGKIKKRGIVISLKNSYDGGYTVKSILQVSSTNLLTEQQVRLAIWIHQYYHASLMKVLKLFIPESILSGTQKEPIKLFVKLKTMFREEDIKRAPKQLEFLRALKTYGGEGFIDDISPKTAKQTVRALEKKGLLTVEERVVYSSPTFSVKSQKKRSFDLSEAQKNIVHAITQAGNEKPFLIHGITGSGKTEVYMELIDFCLQHNQGAILLVPEIALTPQTIQRFKNKFPKALAVWHHKLSQGEKASEWMRLKRGEAKVMIGSRSALFQPVQNLGIIIIDEEHETSYKQDQEPRYHARDVAIRMSQIFGCKVVLGSATPNITSLHNTEEKTYVRYALTERFGSSGLPPVSIVDMKYELKNRNYSMFSKKLQIELGRTLEQNNQAILFMNRRGAASSVVCRSCGWKASCPHCDIALTMHRVGQIVGKEKLLCHYCNYSIPVQVVCPECNSKHVKPLGGGTQKVVQELSFMFPDARIVRADRDTTKTKNALGEIYEQFKNHEADILVGTQMIAKGWDIPNVRLVGIMMADIGLNMPDFMAEERIFSVLTQVAGRAGRDSVPGVVVLQTYAPDNPTLLHASKHDYHTFYEYEIEKRKEFQYPPFTHLTKITLVGPNELKVQGLINQKKTEIEHVITQLKLPIELLGPAPNTIPKIYHKYHYHILLKSQNVAPIHTLLENVDLSAFRVDIDPLGF